MKLIKNAAYTTLLACLLSSNVMAGDCSYELFSISSTKNTKIIDFIEQLSDECEFSIVVTDPKAQEFLNNKLNKTNLNNLTIQEVLDIVLRENNLSYKLENNILKISYLETKMFSIDYILSQRKSQSNTNITLSSEGAGKSTTTGTSTTSTALSANSLQGGGSAGKSGMKIESQDEMAFWHELDLEFQKVINRPEDIYAAEAPIVNKNAGIITVTATTKQMDRFEKYLKNLQDKVQLQVLIDVQILSVNLSDNKSTGIDWAQLYKLQDIDMSFNYVSKNNLVEFKNDGGILGTTSFDTMGQQAVNNAHVFQMSAKGNLNEVVKFLKTQGDVSSISNPKVLTLNNQSALITSGTEYFYKILNTQTLATGTSGTQSTSEDLQSVFAGVLLDITPEISENDMITLKINPSLSETASDIASIAGQDRKMPPDLNRRQLSSVVKVKDGQRIILGGLINTTNGINVNKVPLLGDIPVLNYLFKYESKQKTTHELVLVIEPHIISKDKKEVSLSDLGYQGLSNDILKSAKEATAELTKEQN